MLRNFTPIEVLELLINLAPVVGQPWPSTQLPFATSCPVPSAKSPEPILILLQDLQSPADLAIPGALLLETSTFALTCQCPCWHVSSMYHLA